MMYLQCRLNDSYASRLHFPPPCLLLNKKDTPLYLLFRTEGSQKVGTRLIDTNAPQPKMSFKFSCL